MESRKKHRKRVGFNLLGTYLDYLYRELGITSDTELAERTHDRVHQTTISAGKRSNRRITRETLLLLLEALRTYPLWDEEKYAHELFVAADHADPREQQALERRLQESGRL